MITENGFLAYVKSSAITVRMPRTYILENDAVPIEVVDWASQCDTNGKGIYVLQVSPEKAWQLKDSVNEAEEAPKDTYCIYIYINQYKGTGLEKCFTGGTMYDNNTVKVFYGTVNKSSEKLPDYELSTITVNDYKINKLKIFIDDNEVEYSLSKLE